mmetsp:Transcript_22752/g.35634  ORF Transcript_22752/g.35634 Transcript_22752/m.35634 type:complete len:123 (-) Transcript_22752:760-1128(-)
MELDWSSCATPLPKVDLVIGSDIAYEIQAFDDLSSCLYKLCSSRRSKAKPPDAYKATYIGNQELCEVDAVLVNEVRWQDVSDAFLESLRVHFDLTVLSTEEAGLAPQFRVPTVQILLLKSRT